MAFRRLPELFQSEASECSLVCLAMVAKYWGRRFSLAQLRSRFSISSRGVTLGALASMAEGIGFDSRGLRLSVDEIGRLKLPCILHWDSSHFVVLKRVSRRFVVVHDPALGCLRISIAELRARFSGAALELSPTESEGSTSTERLQVQVPLFGRYHGLWAGLIQVLILGFLLQLYVVATPFYMQWMVDRGIEYGDDNLANALALGFALLVLVQVGVGALRSVIAARATASLGYQWLGNVFSHLLRLPVTYFEKRNAGVIASQFESIHVIKAFVSTQLVEGLIDALLVMVALPIMFLYSPFLALISVVALSLYVIVRFISYESYRTQTAALIGCSARQSAHFLESLRNVQAIKVFGIEELRKQNWTRLLSEQMSKELRLQSMLVTFGAFSALVFGLERVLVIWLAAGFVMDNWFSVGMLFAYLSFKEQFTARAVSLLDKLFELKVLRVHTERVADIVHTDAQELVESQCTGGYSGPFDVEFRNVSFRYGDQEPWVLRGVSFFIPDGACVAIVGASGSGKTTLSKLALGLIEPTEGEVLVRGVPVSRLVSSSEGRKVSAVAQADELFEGSIADNVSMFDDAVDLEKVWNCLRIAELNEDVLRMPMGLNTIVGHGSSGFSAGQRQRVLLARALYATPSLLILDEATAHLDTATEAAVTRAIAELRATRIIIAHRANAVAIAHRIIELSQGQILSDS